jgi:hypothetical protein
MTKEGHSAILYWHCGICASGGGSSLRKDDGVKHTIMMRDVVDGYLRIDFS